MLLQYSAMPHEFTRVVPVEGQDSRCLFFHEMICTYASHDTSLHMCRYMYRILMLLPYLASLVDRQIDCRKWLARFRFSPPFLLPFTCKRAIKRKTHIHLLTDHMIQTTFRVRLAHQCPGRDQLRTLRSLTHLRDMASNLNSMPQKEPTGRETGQDSTEITRNQANQSDSRPVKNRSRPSRASTQAKDKDIGASSSSNNSHGTFSSSQSTQHSNRSHNPNSTANRRLNSGAGQNNIHSTATSTRPSFLNSQWRTHSTQASSQEAGTPSTTDTEGLTQALQQLTTEDKAQDTATTTNPTKSRWRTAKPNSKQETSTNQQTSSNNPATTSTKTPSNNPTAHFFYTKAPPGLRRPQRHQGTATGLHSIEASWTLH